MNINEILPLTNLQNTVDIVKDVRTILEEARCMSTRAVNSTMVFAYWLIGRRIVLEEQQGQNRAAYGEMVLKRLSKSLESEFGVGFSYANLRNMRQFYRTYPDVQICYTLCINLPCPLFTQRRGDKKRTGE